MESNDDTIYDVACTHHEGRWYATIVEPGLSDRAALLRLEADDIDDLPFTAVDVLVRRRRIRPWRLRLLGPQLQEHFTGERAGRRVFHDITGDFAESWFAFGDGETVTVAIRRSPIR